MGFCFGGGNRKTNLRSYNLEILRFGNFMIFYYLAALQLENCANFCNWAILYFGSCCRCAPVCMCMCVGVYSYSWVCGYIFVSVCTWKAHCVNEAFWMNSNQNVRLRTDLKDQRCCVVICSKRISSEHNKKEKSLQQNKLKNFLSLWRILVVSFVYGCKAMLPTPASDQ